MGRNRMLATATLALSLTSASLGAQVTEVSRTAIVDAAQVTFGYLCDDRFVIRNDGTKAVDLEYGLEKGTEHTRITLNGREAVELASTSRQAMELWMDGKLIAKASKEKVSCKDVQGNASVTVNPLQVTTTARQQRAYGYGSPYAMYDPWMNAYYGYGYGAFGYRPYYRSVIAYPVVVRPRGRGRRH